jgi:hypothetical protein
MGGSDDDQFAAVLNQNASVSSLLGLSPASPRLGGYEGQQLPASTYTGADKAAVWWSPDSPTFWLIALGGGTLLGLFGAHVQVRAGRTRASAEVGNQ